MYQATPETLNKIAAASAMLIASEPTPARVALPMLHFRNAHPVGLAEFETFFAQSGGRKEALKSGLKAFVQVVLSARRREKSWFGDAIPKKADILFVSHFVNQIQAAGGQDNYFGKVPVQLQEAGLTSVVAHVNHTWVRWEDVKIDWQPQIPPRVVFGRTGSLLSELSLLKRLNLAAKHVRRAGAGQSDPLVKNLADHVANNRFHTAGSFGLRTAQQITKLVQTVRPKYLVTTFEGHVWERLAFQAARAVDPGIIRLGYHHTILFPEQKALANSIGSNFDPDVILTAGQVSAKWFQEQPAWTETPVVSVGSVRSIENPAQKPCEAGACLVAPEGIVAEAVALFSTALEAADKARDQQFHLRLHPVMTRQAFLQAAPRFKQLPENVSWSEGPLDQALSVAKYVFYRGSTVALTAVLGGLRPIYLAKPGEPFCLDPLVEAGAWRKEVADGLGLAKVLAEDASTDAAQRQKDFREGVAYCGHYFEPLSPQAFREALDCARVNP